MQRVLSGSLVVPIIVSLAVVLASFGPVDDAIVRAQTQAADGDLPAAIEMIRRARQQHDDPDLLYVEAQLHRLNDDCPRAIPLYEAFLATDPPQEDRLAAATTLERCTHTREIDAAPAPEPTPQPPPPIVETPPPSPAQPAPDPAPEEQGPDRVSIALWVSGGALVVGGASTYGAAWGMRSSATRDDLTLDAYLDRERTARTLGGVGLALLGSGAAILIGATIRHFVQRR